LVHPLCSGGRLAWQKDRSHILQITAMSLPEFPKLFLQIDKLNAMRESIVNVLHVIVMEPVAGEVPRMHAM
jgi:hypothetical protein